MGVEVEKKYRATGGQSARLRRRLAEVGAERRGEEFEENTLYTGPNLERGGRVLRLRRAGSRATLTFKERMPSESAVKHHREDETRVEDPQALASILEALGYRPALVYEKRRETWLLAGVEVVLDELPFGLFVEIEGDEDSIQKAERLLELADAEPEHATYPQLALRYGAKNGDLTEARFPSNVEPS